uniref:Uncharacterized protein n=1 Tax=Anguilla anguilla TaxID=7936 RepID=A0A0E9RZ08_ANGAN
MQASANNVSGLSWNGSAHYREEKLPESETDYMSQLSLVTALHEGSALA